MNNNLLILGAGGHGRVVKETAKAIGSFNKIDFLDDNSNIAIGACNDYEKYINQYSYAFVAFGNHDLRMNWMNVLIQVGFKIPTLIHPTAYISPSSIIGEGSFVGVGAIINTNVVVEKGCIIGIGALIDHDSIVSEYCHINTGAIVKSGSRIHSFIKVDAGIVYSNT